MKWLMGGLIGAMEVLIVMGGCWGTVGRLIGCNEGLTEGDGGLNRE